MAALHTRWTHDAAEYLTHAGAFLTAHPVEHSVLLTTAHRMSAEPPGEALWLWVEHHGQVVAAAQQVPSWHAYVSRLPDEAVHGLVERLHEMRPELPGVGGMRADAEAFGRAWRSRTGAHVATAMGQGVYVADAVQHPDGVAGRLRVAEVADVELVQRWSEGFQAELGSEHVPRVDERPRVLSGLAFLWESAGRPVALAAASRPYGNVVRVSLVYTPPEHRRRGYAAACVAAVTGQQLRGATAACSTPTWPTPRPIASTSGSATGA